MSNFHKDWMRTSKVKIFLHLQLWNCSNFGSTVGIHLKLCKSWFIRDEISSYQAMPISRMFELVWEGLLPYFRTSKDRLLKLVYVHGKIFANYRWTNCPAWHTPARDLNWLFNCKIFANFWLTNVLAWHTPAGELNQLVYWQIFANFEWTKGLAQHTGWRPQ